MVSIPQNLKGATVLEAHQWVVSTLDGFNEYVLKDNSGMDVTLSDITRGTVNEVQVMPAGSRMNPAPSYAFKPEHQPQKRIQQFSSRVMLPQGISPSVVHALEAKHGASYRFIASKMLSQRSRRQQLSPKGTRMLRSSIMADPLVRNNPIGLRQTPSGLRMTRVIGDRGRLMDDAIVAEVKGYLEGQALPFDAPASERQFKDFTQNVMRPYLISVRANQALIRYLNETLLPHMLRLIDSGDFDSDFTEIGIMKSLFRAAVGKIPNVKSAAGKDTLKRALSKQYETVVRRLATSPQDFYYGRSEALIAHPAFMYPHAAYFLLPPPERLTGVSRAELFFFQAGEAPRYSVRNGEITQEMPPKMLKKFTAVQGPTRPGETLGFTERMPIARVNNQPVNFSSYMNTENVDTALRSGNVGQVILMASQAFANNGVLSRMFGLGAATPPSGLTEEESDALNDLNTIVRQIHRTGSIEVFRPSLGPAADDLPLAAAIEVNIGGIKPKPMGWPEGLIFAMMSVLQENSDQLMDLGGMGDVPTEFWRPNISGVGSARITLHAPRELADQIEHLTDADKSNVMDAFSGGIVLEDLIREDNSAAEISKVYGNSIALHLATNVGVGHGAISGDIIPDAEGGRAAARTAFQNNTALNPTTSFNENDARLTKFTHIQNISSTSGPQTLSLLNLVQLALTRFKQDGGNPTPEHVTFVAQLTMYTLAQLNTTFEAVGEPEGLMELFREGAAAFRADQIAENQERVANYIAQLDQRAAAIPEENVLQQIVMDRLLENMLDEVLAGGDLNDVFENPRRNPPLPSLAEILGGGQNSKDMVAIKKARDALRGRRRDHVRAGGAFRPDEATIEQLTESLRGVFAQALAEATEEREQAEQAILRQGQVTRLLGEFEDRESLREQMNAYQQTMRDVERALRTLIVSEQRFVEAFEAVPMDPTMELEDNLTRQEMFNHPLYTTQNLFGQHRMFMDHIVSVENALRTTLSMVRGEAVRSGIMDIHAPNIEYLMSAMEFCNGLQEEYANVGSSLGAAVDDMRVDDKDSISPHLYIALFDVADNFSIREGVRSALRRSSSTTGRSVDPTISEPAFRTMTAKAFDLIGTLFGAFPGNVPTHPPNQIMDMGKEYLNDLVDADLDFSGDMQSEHRRGELIAKAVSLTDSIERRMKRQLEGYYDREARMEAMNTFSGDVGLASFLTTGVDDAITRTDRLARADKFDPSKGYLLGNMFNDFEADIEAAKAEVGRQSMFRDLFAQQRQIPIDSRNEKATYSLPVETEEDKQWRMANLFNDGKLRTMFEVGQINKRMLDFALRERYTPDIVQRIIDGARKGREAQAAAREVAKEIKRVNEAIAEAGGVTIDIPGREFEEAYNEYMYAVSREDLAYGQSGADFTRTDIDPLTAQQQARYYAGDDYPRGNPSEEPVEEWDIRPTFRPAGVKPEAVNTKEEFQDLNRRMKEQRDDFHFRDDFKEEVDSRHSRFDSKPLPKRGGGFLPPLYAGSTVPVSDTRARNVTRGPAVKWSEESKGIGPKSASRPVSKPLGREAFGLKNGRKVHWSE